MVILKPDNEIHEITIIPRINASEISIVIKNESKNTTETIEDIATTYSSGYLTFEITKTVLEQESFEYAVYDLDSELLFRGKAFATNQTDLQNYKIN
jgi:hypothetical protein